MIQYGTERKLSRSALAKQAWPYKFTIHCAIVQSYVCKPKKIGTYCTPKLSRLQSEASKISLSKLKFYKFEKVDFTQFYIGQVRTVIDVFGWIDNLQIPYLLKKCCRKSTCLTSQIGNLIKGGGKKQKRKLSNLMF